MYSLGLPDRCAAGSAAKAEEEVGRAASITSIIHRFFSLRPIPTGSLVKHFESEEAFVN